MIFFCSSKLYCDFDLYARSPFSDLIWQTDRSTDLQTDRLTDKQTDRLKRKYITPTKVHIGELSLSLLLIVLVLRNYDWCMHLIAHWCMCLCMYVCVSVYVNVWKLINQRPILHNDYVYYLHREGNILYYTALTAVILSISSILHNSIWRAMYWKLSQ